MECTLFKFADENKRQGPADLLEARPAIQRDPGGLEKRADRSFKDLHEIQWGEMQSTAPGKEEPLQQPRLWRDWLTFYGPFQPELSVTLWS